MRRLTRLSLPYLRSFLMRERIERLFGAGKINAGGVRHAVTLGWISSEDADAILSAT